MSVELVLLTPLFLLVIALLVLCGRVMDMQERRPRRWPIRPPAPPPPNPIPAAPRPPPTPSSQPGTGCRTRSRR